MFKSPFDDDPFFDDAMAEMMGMGRPMMDPFQQQYAAGRRRRNEPSMALSPFGMGGMFGGGLFGGSLFGGMSSMMSDMENTMRMMHSGGGGAPGSSFQSSFTSISYGSGDGQPKVYQASSSTKVGPNGVKETQKSEKNSVTGLHKMSIGHHIGDRAHVIEKSKNITTGDEEESQEFVNIDEENADEFNHEFKQRIRSAPMSHRAISHHPNRRHSPYNSQRHEPAALEYYQPSSSKSQRRSKKRNHQ